MSIVGTFAVMYLLGYSLDNLSLMALTLSVGFVVDDAIVMLENIVRHMEMGKTRMQAALEGAREIGFTIVSMTLSLAAVFIPVLFMGGIIGRLFHEFAVTISVAILVSGFVSLTLTPMLCSRFLTPPRRPAPRPPLPGRPSASSTRCSRLYEWSLDTVLAHRAITMVVSGLDPGRHRLSLRDHPKGFIPSEDTGRIIGVTEAPQDISFERWSSTSRRSPPIVAQDPNVDAFMSSVGRAAAITSEHRPALHLAQAAERAHACAPTRSSQELRPKLAPSRHPRLPPEPAADRIGGQVTKSQYQYTLQGPDID